MKTFIFIDASSLWIEGQKLSAIRKGKAVDLQYATKYNILDTDWNIEYGKLLDYIALPHSKIDSVALYGWSRIEDDDSIWEMRKRNKFAIQFYDKSLSATEMKIDTELVTDIIMTMYEMDKQDVAILIAGTNAYKPIVEAFQMHQKNLFIAFWSHASNGLKTRSSFMELNDYFDTITKS